LPDTSNDDGNDVDGDDGFVLTLSLVAFKVMTAVLTTSLLSPHSADATPLVAA
jgi:hypothetical protein